MENCNATIAITEVEDTFDYDLLKTCINQDFNPTEKRKAITRKTREYVYGRDKDKCRICGYSRFGEKKVGKYTYPKKRVFFVHHVAPKEPSIPENLISICVLCHDYVHGQQSRRVKGFKFHKPK